MNPRHPLRLGAAALAATLALVTPALPANATAGVTNLEGYGIRIEGEFAPGATIPAGTPIEIVLVETADPYTGSGDGARLALTEDFTITVEGEVVATSLPWIETTVLETNGGRIGGTGFAAAGSTYLMPETGTDLSGVAETVAPGRVQANGLSSLSTYQRSLLPVGAVEREADVYVEQWFQGRLRASGVSTRTLLDADDVRGNADSPGEEVGPDGTEGVVQFRLNKKGKVEARVLRYAFTIYGVTTFVYVVETAPFEDRGVTLGDIKEARSFTASPHDLGWNELGFPSAS